MPLKTRKSKKQRFNRRKSRKIGGSILVRNAENKIRKGIVHKRRQQYEPIQQLSNTDSPAAAAPAPAPAAENASTPAVEPASKQSGTAVENNNVKRSSSVSSTPPVNTTEVTSNLQQSNDPLCQLKVGDLVEYVKSDETKTLAYVKIEVNDNKVTLSDNEEVEISKLQKYQYQDILLSLSKILQFVLENKDKPKKLDNEQKPHIEKINSIKQNLEAVQNKLTPQGNT